ncbi:VPS10 domain-containing receptor SorCS2-like [Labrus mixtus]|uniref:VPS10 domain-containing receptor SorCS2-like n=1 Tax=Labrus mixtus TaxID=508554 RepID=UPI0029BFF099|nr:VPS10 domain-containing receptor SorCS2-like [Labrus mixtus]
MEGKRCFADFWHDPDSPPEDCHLGQTYESSTGYRKVISNTCEGGVNKEQSAKQHNCPLLPPKGLQVGIKGQMLAVAPGDDITFIVHQEQGDTSSTKYQVDLGDGVRAIYQNLTVTDEPIQHRYEQPGVYKVTVMAENMAGHDEATMYIQVTGQPPRLLQMFDSIMKQLWSYNFQVIPLSFSRNLDRFNPNIPEWRADIGQVVTKLLTKITGVPQESLVTVVNPGLPTSADLYVLPQDSKPDKRNMFVDKRIPAIMQAFNNNNVSFVVRGGLKVLVMLADPNAGYHGAAGGPGVWAGAAIFLISLIATGSFILYKFKR